jgi:NADH-quinone oxidoreductase subunit N
MNVFSLLLPEIVLSVAALVLFVSAFIKTAAARKAAPWIALIACVVGAVISAFQLGGFGFSVDGAVRVGMFAGYVKLLVCVVGALLVLLMWHDDEEGTGNRSLNWGRDAGEFFALVLLSLTGACLAGGSNDMMLLFLGVELASIPTYILVAMSRPLSKAQEAGVKYFFLGAASAALMLMGFAFLYGAYGITDLHEIGRRIGLATITDAELVAMPMWVTLGLLLLVIGFAFKMAAAPLHFYAGDVYEGAATPVTALLSFVPKAVGTIALLKVLFATGGNNFATGEQVVLVLAVMAALTMTIGNVLALLQSNVKRMLAYSSVAHSGYILVGVAAAATGGVEAGGAVAAVLFYLTAYAIMNVGSFGVLMLVAKRPWMNEEVPPATGAETLDDLAGVGRDRPGLGVAMAVSMFALIGLPLTVGFFGKLFLLIAGWEAGLGWLVVVTVINAAISAGYYLRVVAVMWLGEPLPAREADERVDAEIDGYRGTLATKLAVAVSTVAVIALGLPLPLVNAVQRGTERAGLVDEPTTVIEAAAVSADNDGAS